MVAGPKNKSQRMGLAREVGRRQLSTTSHLCLPSLLRPGGPCGGAFALLGSLSPHQVRWVCFHPCPQVDVYKLSGYNLHPLFLKSFVDYF